MARCTSRSSSRVENEIFLSGPHNLDVGVVEGICSFSWVGKVGWKPKFSKGEPISGTWLRRTCVGTVMSPFRPEAIFLCFHRVPSVSWFEKWTLRVNILDVLCDIDLHTANLPWFQKRKRRAIFWPSWPKHSSHPYFTLRFCILLVMFSSWTLSHDHVTFSFVV